MCPGCVRVKSPIVLDLLGNVCAEISRNGCKKIILLNRHGGSNGTLIRFFVQSRLGQEINYVPYLVVDLGLREFHAAMFKTRCGHACECETSVMLHLAPESTHPEWIPEQPGDPDPRIDHLAGRVLTPVWHYGPYPTHYCGDARLATEEKGELFFKARAKSMVEIIRLVKEDEAAPRLFREYNDRIYQG